MKAGKYYLALAIIAGVLCASAAGETELPQHENKSVLIGQPNPALVGLERLSVIIVPPDNKQSKDGLAWNKLQAKINRKLWGSGIKIIAGVASNVLEIPELQIYVDMLKLDDSQQYVFRIQTSLAIKVSLAKEQRRYVKAVAWKIGSSIQAVSVKNMPEAITDQVYRQVEAFISSWQQANRAGAKADDTALPTTQNGQEPKLTAKSVQAEYKYVASKNSKVFHKADCGSVKSIKPENLVTYNSTDEASKTGKRPCKRCKP